MRRYDFRILNVFAIPGAPLSGNPLCVFEDGRGLDAALMQALALQFNLSETTFILPSATASARVRIFTPSYEMPFAGHPTLGSAHVVRSLRGEGPDAALTLELEAGIIPVQARADAWTLQAGPVRTRSVTATLAQLAEMLGLAAHEVAANAAWVNTGTEQLILPLTAADALERIRPVPELVRAHAALTPERQCVYVFAERAPGVIGARFFFSKGASVIEDPATGLGVREPGRLSVDDRRSAPARGAGRARRAHRAAESARLAHRRTRPELRLGHVLELGRGAITLP